MKILFWGDTTGNSGPSNINKGITASLTRSFLPVQRRKKYSDFIVGFCKLMQSNVLVVSNASRKGYLLMKIAKMLGKPSVYIMHGCGEYETKLNHATYPDNRLAWEAYLMENADRLLPVSRKFMNWVHAHYPQYKDKTDYLYNGINRAIFDNACTAEKGKGSVAVSGGLTPLKNNMLVLQAVETMNGKAFLTIYGNADTDSVWERQHTRLAGMLSHDQFLKELACTQLFVLNSIFETFSIAVVEALACGCSILVSEVAGITDLLALEETDIIHDPMDVEEIRRKIEYLLDHPNHDRIFSKFDINEWTFDKMVQRLEQHCKELIKSRY